VVPSLFVTPTSTYPPVLIARSSSRRGVPCPVEWIVVTTAAGRLEPLAVVDLRRAARDHVDAVRVDEAVVLIEDQAFPRRVLADWPARQPHRRLRVRRRGRAQQDGDGNAQAPHRFAHRR